MLICFLRSPHSGGASGLAALPPEEVGAAGSAAAGAEEEAAAGGWWGGGGRRSGPRCLLQRAEQLPAPDSTQHPGLALAGRAGTGEGTCHRAAWGTSLTFTLCGQTVKFRSPDLPHVSVSPGEPRRGCRASDSHTSGWKQVSTESFLVTLRCMGLVGFSLQAALCSHRTAKTSAEAGAAFVSLWCHILLSQGHPELRSQDHVLEYLQGWRAPLPSIGNLDQVHLHREEVSDMQRNPPAFCFVPMMSSPATGHHWEESGSVLSALPIGYIYVYEIPLSFFGSEIDSPSSASLP